MHAFLVAAWQEVGLPTALYMDNDAVWRGSSAQKPVDVDTESMGSELGIETSAKPPKRVSVIGLDVKLLSELSVDGLDDLAHSTEEATG